jgi:hypothetical protein
MRSHIGITFDGFCLILWLFFGEIPTVRFLNKLMLFFGMYYLVLQYIQSLPSGSDLIFNFISLIFADVPVQLKEFV